MAPTGHSLPSLSTPWTSHGGFFGDWSSEKNLNFCSLLPVQRSHEKQVLLHSCHKKIASCKLLIVHIQLYLLNYIVVVVVVVVRIVVVAAGINSHRDGFPFGEMMSAFSVVFFSLNFASHDVAPVNTSDSLDTLTQFHVVIS